MTLSNEEYNVEEEIAIIVVIAFSRIQTEKVHKTISIKTDTNFTF